MRKPIKIMRIIARLNVGGPAIHVTLLTKYLHNADFESTLVCGQVGAAEGDMSYLADQHGVKPIMIPELGREISLRQDILIIWKLMKLMRQIRPDVVHTHTAKAGFVGRIAAWLSRVPVRVHTFHGHVFHGYFSPLKTRVFLYLERFLARLSTRIITISPKLKQELTEIYHIAPPDKFIVVPLGLDLVPLAESPSPLAGSGEDGIRQRFNLPADQKLVGIVGRLVPIKNHGLFLRAARQVTAQRSDVHFVIIGDGECRPNIEQMIRDFNLTERVSLIGWVQQIGAVLRDLDVLALTSDNEGTPVSIIEAMAAGVPVISTAVGGVADVLEQGRFGVLVPPQDADAFANGLLQILSGDHVDVSAAQEAALTRYDIQRLASDLGKLYISLLK